MQVFQILVLLTLAALLTIVHEWAHLRAARWFDLPVQCVKIGVGPELFRWRSKAKHGTEYVVHWLPLSGHVQFSKGSPWQRTIVFLAGPAMNLVLAVALVVADSVLTNDSFFHLWANLNNSFLSGNDVLLIAAYMSRSYTLLNMLPLGGLDGAQALASFIRALTGNRIVPLDNGVELSRRMKT